VRRPDGGRKRAADLDPGLLPALLALEGRRHPDRDAQFRYLNEQVKEHQDAAGPVISVDIKKKELAGRFANAGREWRPGGQPVLVNSHDFPQDSAGSVTELDRSCREPHHRIGCAPRLADRPVPPRASRSIIPVPGQPPHSMILLGVPAT
jgi:Rhodopirellula transposase DDE domain